MADYYVTSAEDPHVSAGNAGDILIIDWTAGETLTKASLTIGRKAL